MKVQFEIKKLTLFNITEQAFVEKKRKKNIYN